MKITDWKSIGELIGIAAVVASLIFVGLELRQTQSALMASTYQARAFDAITSTRELADSEYIGPILARIDLDDKNSLAELSSEEMYRARQWFVNRMIDYDNEYYQYQKGFLDEGYFEDRFKSTVKVWARRWRSVGIGEIRPEFSQFVDDLLAADSTE